MNAEIEGVNEYGQTWAEAWDRYFENHPDTLAIWGKSNGRWVNCTCALCDPNQLRPRPNIIEPPPAIQRGNTFVYVLTDGETPEGQALPYVKPLKSSHECRRCRRWLEGEWSSASPEERIEIERQMSVGRCDDCTRREANEKAPDEGGLHEYHIVMWMARRLKSDSDTWEHRRFEWTIPAVDEEHAKRGAHQIMYGINEATGHQWKLANHHDEPEHAVQVQRST